MNVNINSSCEFVLTETGAAIWNAQYSANLPAKWRPEPKQAGDKVVSQLWCVMEVFGPHTHMGMSGAHFENNNLEITPC